MIGYNEYRVELMRWTWIQGTPGDTRESSGNGPWGIPRMSGEPQGVLRQTDRHRDTGTQRHHCTQHGESLLTEAVHVGTTEFRACREPQFLPWFGSPHTGRERTPELCLSTPLRAAPSPSPDPLLTKLFEILHPRRHQWEQTNRIIARIHVASFAPVKTLLPSSCIC